MFRAPLVRLLSAIKSMKVGDAELEFSDKLAEAEVIASGAIPQAQMVETDEVSTEEKQALRRGSPRDAVMEHWIMLWQDVARAVRAKQPELSSATLMNSSRLIDEARATGVLNNDQIALLRELRNMRNIAAHAPTDSISERDVMRYVTTARSLRNAIKR